MRKSRKNTIASVYQIIGLIHLIAMSARAFGILYLGWPTIDDLTEWNEYIIITFFFGLFPIIGSTTIKEVELQNELMIIICLSLITLGSLLVSLSVIKEIADFIIVAAMN